MEENLDLPFCQNQRLNLKSQSDLLRENGGKVEKIKSTK